MQSKNILIISYTYPPNPGVGGIRIKNFAKYFSKYGYETYILCAKLKNKTIEDTNIVIQTDEDLDNRLISKSNVKSRTINLLMEIKCIEKIISYLKYYYYFPDKYKWWFGYALPKAKKLFEEHHFNVVISSSIPIAAHFVAAELKKKHNFFWIAEFRDLWTYNHYYPTDFLYSFISKKLERKLLSKADHLITVSQPLADNLRKIHLNKAVSVITNGFEPKEKVNCMLTKSFSITYTGILYGGRRDPTLLFQAMKRLIDQDLIDKNNVKIRFFGPTSTWLEKLIYNYSLQDIVTQHGEVERNVVLRAQGESQLLLLLMFNHPAEKGVYTAKVFEYLNARRPILALGNKDSVIFDLFQYTNAGFVTNQLEELTNIILKLYYQFIKTGEVSYEGIEDKILEYSFNELINKYISILPKSK